MSSLEASSLEAVIAALPKADLHVHLVGSASVDTVLELARRRPAAGIPVDRAGLAKLYEFKDFDHFIEVYYAVDAVVTTPDDIVTLVVGLARDAAASNVRWAEVTVTADSHLRAGIAAADLRTALEVGRGAARTEHGVDLGWIFDSPMERGLPAADATVEFLQQHAPDGTVGIGLAGAEVEASKTMFAPHVAAARALGLNVAIHAGETAGPEAVWSALRDLGADRIGHGLSSVQDPDLLTHLATHDVPVEVCVSSNLATGAVPTLAEHPVLAMLDAGVPVTLGTDDPGMFATDLNREYALVAELAGLEAADLHRLARRSFTASFAPDGVRGRALSELDAGGSGQ
jgi:aminodeoxyfutalosine deaminase